MLSNMGRTSEIDRRPDVAQICVNGHIVNYMMRTFPESNATFCKKCGEKSIHQCITCSGTITGGTLGDYGQYDRPAFCTHCGKSHPWTERAQQAAIELFAEEMESTSIEERTKTEESIRAVIGNSASAPSAAIRLAKYIGRFSEGARKLAYDIFKDVVSDAIKKGMFPGK